MTITIPSAPSELEDMLKNPSQMRDVFADKDAFKDFIRNYAKATMEKDTSIAAQVREETQRILAEFVKDGKGIDGKRLDLRPDNNAMIGRQIARQRNSIYNRKAPGAALDNEFEGSADYFQSIWHHSDSLTNRDELRGKLDKVRKIQNSFGSVVPADGGFLIPETLRAEILSVSLETAIVRPRARVIPMDTLRVPIPTIDSTSNASSVYGGIVAYWTEEGATLTESQASFGRVVLDAKKLTAYAEVPNELVADAPAFGAFFDQLFPEAVAYYEDYAFLMGSGVGEPLGVLNAGNPGVVQVLENTADSVKWDDVVAMYARMLPQSLGRAVWVASIDTFPQLAKMAVSGAATPIWFNNGAEGPPVTILGRPVIFTEKPPKLGTTGFGALSFIDFGYYLIGDRQAMSAQSSPHYKFANDKTAFRIIERVDGRPWMQSAITPKNGSATLSPYVSLQSA